jgi:hypothetical protein
MNTGGSSVIIIESKSDEYFMLNAAVPITAGDVIAIGSDGDAYQASTPAAGNKPGIGFAANTVDTGELLYVLLTGDIIDISGADFDFPSDLWLTEWVISSPNYSTIKPSPVAGYYVQYLGRTLSETTIEIMIAPAEEVVE